MSDPAATIQSFRCFNRFYTRLLGLFNRRFLESPLTLAEARALFEIVAEPGISAAGLSRSLGMDRSQVSRVLGRLIKAELVERQGTPGGRRALPLTATDQGRAVLAKLEKSADEQAAQLLTRLDERHRRRLRAALTEVECLLGTLQHATPHLQLREAAPGDLGWIISRHAEIYAREWGFTGEFEKYVLLGIAEYLQKDPARSRVWIAELSGAPAGSVGLVELSMETAQLRWLLVEPHARGLHLGKKLVQQAISFAKDQNYARIILWTLGDLLPARALYQSLGFTLTEKKSGTMGGQPKVEECWTLELGG